MIIIRTAFKNILGGGKRTWLNVAVLSFVLVVMVAYNGIIDGWLDESRRDTHDWETAGGQIWHPEYDRFDVFTLQDAHGTLPPELAVCTQNGTATPVLVVQASVFPQGRMINVLLKGTDPGQQILKLPSEKLVARDGEIVAMIGTRMAKSANLKEGDRVMIRWRDKNGVFDAREIVIAHIFSSRIPGVDSGQIWLSLDDLYAMTGMDGEATYVVKSENCPVVSDVGGWIYKDTGFLMADIDLMEQGSRVESAVIFIILLAIALLAVFDTQTLSIFRRQKEIGTYVALGMTPNRVVRLFTFEGTTYSIIAILAAAAWGSPLLYLFSKTGMPMPEAYDDLGVPLGEALYPAYTFSSILTVIIILIALSAVVSFMPARKIARQNIVYALKGKIN